MSTEFGQSLEKVTNVVKRKRIKTTPIGKHWGPATPEEIAQLTPCPPSSWEVDWDEGEYQHYDRPRPRNHVALVNEELLNG
ncbi:MAG: hypothetical protein V1808_02025 [Candidatus Daviesbacteria bacterium]